MIGDGDDDDGGCDRHDNVSTIIYVQLVSGLCSDCAPHSLVRMVIRF
jgi:hypothetical protein